MIASEDLKLTFLNHWDVPSRIDGKVPRIAIGSLDEVNLVEVEGLAGI